MLDRNLTPIDILLDAAVFSQAKYLAIPPCAL
jgi:hypothetical protein